MLSDDEEILLEQHITYNHMSKDERDFCMNLIINTKDISDSEVVFNNNSNSHFDIINMNIVKKGYDVLFNGNIANNNEFRCIDGRIIRIGNKYCVKTNVYRLHEMLEEDEKDYSTEDIFEIKDDHIIRKSGYYPAIGYYEDELPLFDDNDLIECYSNMINKREHQRNL